MCEDIPGIFVSEKISKIRWKNENFSDAYCFLTGSWDDSVNKISYWNFQKSDEEELCPVRLSSYTVLGDVTELKFLNNNFFVVSTSVGTVKLLQLQDDQYASFKEHMSWDNIHSFETAEYASCTSIANFENDTVSVGEDGKINFLTVSQKKPVRIIENADSCSICCVDFLRHNEILTGNSRGHLKVWDLRKNQDDPATTFMLSDQTKTNATSIVHHPTQRHIVVAGGGDGSLAVWDLRHNTYPISQLNAHTKAVNEILFHPDRPDNLFTCSASGELWHWNNTQNSKLKLDTSDTHWLNSIVGNTKVNATSLFNLHKPINSIDINRSTLIFGCDNEAMYTIRNVAI